MHAEGSVLVEMGQTRVLCTASVETNIPKWLQGTGKGWITGEYGMLPRSTNTRIQREKAMNSGRTQEISRLIARSLRAACDLKLLGERQITVDCDVLQADGGTRTAAINGGFVALALAIAKLKFAGLISKEVQPLKRYIGAVSVGITHDKVLLDLDYEEDSTIGTDLNLVLTHEKDLVEVQGTAEGEPFSTLALARALETAVTGIDPVFAAQKALLAKHFPEL